MSLLSRMFLHGLWLASHGHCILIWCGIALEQALWARRETKELIHHSETVRIRVPDFNNWLTQPLNK
ncbi:hypothetical protein [Nitrosomonas sp. Nm166]|uniref:hypothetical protein n=1 Tax=Nitrosomonas sp. Nm166 TaxID=1881054 RepID=UPI00116084D9|nr:hypothetical protein [Nitrosomonas sp. Nm166]